MNITKLRSTCSLPCLVMLAALGSACADPCLDDGLGQEALDEAECPAIASGTESETDSDSNTETESDSDSNSNSNTVSNSASNSNSNSNSNTDTDSATLTDTDSSTVSDTDSATDTDSVTDTDSATETETDSDTDSATETETDSDTDSAGDCNDGMQNGDETDVDCGGSCPDDCDVGEGCMDGDDCVSMTCDDIADICVDPTCANGMQDGDETDVDCGGSCGATCEDGETCTIDGDCINANCDDQGVCQPNPLWCVDLDGDGFGDGDDCVMVPEDEEPPDGTVPNGDDCDDTNENTFPGAAPADDPNACMKDDDGDDWGDDTPPNGVDPGSDCDEDGEPACVLVVTQDGTGDNTYDQGLVGVLDDLGFEITFVADTEAVLEDANGFTLVVISETAQSTDIGGTYETVLVPTICLEGLVWDDMSMAPEGAVVASDSVTIIAPLDPLAAGLAGNVDVISGGGSGTFSTTPQLGAIEVASVPLFPLAIVEFAFDQDLAMLGGFVAPRRRLGLGLDADQGNGAVTIETDGLLLFEAAVLWAIG